MVKENREVKLKRFKSYDSKNSNENDTNYMSRSPEKKMEISQKFESTVDNVKF